MEILKRLDAWQSDWVEPSAAALARRNDLLAGMSARERKLAGRMLREARASRSEMTYRFTGPYVHSLTLESRVALTYNARRLLDLAGEALEKTGSLRQWFEAVSLFDQAVALAAIERADSIKRVAHELGELVDFFLEELCDGVQTITFFSYHKEPSFQVECLTIDEPERLPGLFERVTEYPCRHLKIGGLAYLDHRPKGAFRTWLKMQRQQRQAKDGRDPYDVSDRRAAMFVLPSATDAYALAEHLDALFKRTGGRLEVVADNMDGGRAMDPDNEHSSDKYRAAKLMAVWKGSRFEIQLCTFKDYLSSKYAADLANHDLYRLQQMRDVYLPILFPESVYDIDWEDGGTQRTLFAAQVAQIGWRMSPELLLG